MLYKVRNFLAGGYACVSIVMGMPLPVALLAGAAAANWLPWIAEFWGGYRCFFCSV
ncbi:hypothetical protein DCCM_3662 [Desulfocucumis palustris]|uniref:Uncharacterized protein n=2 Tax=Desulfocucumis palustris TaxID=1898651 RepID=A0A2L2XFQ9_9FIRM|nr:hypothetical protein DCCM_3662 [Desulfocucumis palustris]